MIFLSFLQLIVGTLILKLIFDILGIPITFLKLLLVASIGSISSFISLTPGNLGITDLVQIVSIQIVGVGVTDAVATTLLWRVINLLLIFVLGPMFSYILLRKLKHNRQNSTLIKNFKS